MMPNFLVIGAAKAGTTSLYHYLQQHPFIFMSPVKEPDFFSHEGETDPSGRFVTDLESYRSLFKAVTNQKAIGEASTAYMSSPKATERVYFYIPDVKLIAVLRDPD